MTSIQRERIEAMAREAKVIRDLWLREREAALATQISANAAIMQKWKGLDNQNKTQSEMMPLSFRHRG